jgi:hypothetical protein
VQEGYDTRNERPAGVCAERTVLREVRHHSRIGYDVGYRVRGEGETARTRTYHVKAYPEKGLDNRSAGWKRYGIAVPSRTNRGGKQSLDESDLPETIVDSRGGLQRALAIHRCTTNVATKSETRLVD